MKNIFLASLILLISLTATAQFTLGPKAGYNASKLSTNLDTVTSNVKSGFQAGLFVRIGNKLYVQPELYYTTQGGVFESNSADWKQKVTIGSLDLPVLVGFKLLNAKVVNLRIMAGPLASFVVNKKIEEAGGITGPIEKADLNSINWGIQVGGGIDVTLVSLDIRYQFGLNDLLQEVGQTIVTSKNNVWVISLGVKIL